MRIIVILLSLMTLALGGCQGNRLNGSTAAPVAVGGDLGGLGVGNGGVTERDEASARIHGSRPAAARVHDRQVSLTSASGCATIVANMIPLMMTDQAVSQ